MSFNQCQECWEQNDNLKENNRVLSENLRESNDKRFELFEKVGELNKAYADLKEENEKLREALSDIASMKYGNNTIYAVIECMSYRARQALGIK